MNLILNFVLWHLEIPKVYKVWELWFGFYDSGIWSLLGHGVHHIRLLSSCIGTTETFDVTLVMRSCIHHKMQCVVRSVFVRIMCTYVYPLHCTIYISKQPSSTGPTIFHCTSTLQPVWRSHRWLDRGVHCVFILLHLKYINGKRKQCKDTL